MIWPADGLDELLGAGAFRIPSVQSESLAESIDRGRAAWTVPVKLTDVDQLRRLAVRANPARQRPGGVVALRCCLVFTGRSREQTPARSLDRHADRWSLLTDEAEVRARAVVQATGPFQKARMPAQSAGSPEDIVQFPGRDIFDWLAQIGLMDRTRADRVDGRMPPTVLVTGVDGGHDMNLRDLQQQGATLPGSLRAVTAGDLELADDAERILSAADAMCAQTVQASTRQARAQGLDVPVHEPSPSPPPRQHQHPTRLSLHDAGITSVIWATGYSLDYGWVHTPCLDVTREPARRRGIGQLPGVYFLALHWMYTLKSGTFLGIGDDASYVVDHLVTQVLRA